jgi:mitofusin
MIQVTKSIGWKVIAVCSAAYAALYAYERVTWTVKAKERAFKRQFVGYACSQLNLVVGLATDNCSAQVER